MAVNAFSVNWSDFLGYLFPPFSMIPKCLEKIFREESNAVMICPVWPSQPWYPVMLGMVCETPRLLQQSSSLLVSARGEPHPLLNSGALQLAAWRLSGRASEGEAFRALWSNYSWPVNPFDLWISMAELGSLVSSTGWKSLINISKFCIGISSGAACVRQIIQHHQRASVNDIQNTSACWGQTDWLTSVN